MTKPVIPDFEAARRAIGPTPKQRAFLQRRGLACPTTKDEATQLIHRIIHDLKLDSIGEQPPVTDDWMWQDWRDWGAW